MTRPLTVAIELRVRLGDNDWETAERTTAMLYNEDSVREYVVRYAADLAERAVARLELEMREHSGLGKS